MKFRVWVDNNPHQVEAPNYQQAAKKAYFKEYGEGAHGHSDIFVVPLDKVFYIIVEETVAVNFIAQPKLK